MVCMSETFDRVDGFISVIMQQKGSGPMNTSEPSQLSSCKQIRTTTKQLSYFKCICLLLTSISL